jgi:hypothetical protein
VERLGLTDTHTLRIASAEIALKGPTEIRIKNHGPEWTGKKAHPATDAPVVSNHHPVALIPENGLCRTYLEAGGIRALQTDNRKPEPLHSILADHPDATPGRTVQTGAPYGAGRFTFQATVASQWIEYDRFHFIDQDRLQRLSSIDPLFGIST